MGHVEGPAISGVAVDAEREGTGLVMVEVEGFFLTRGGSSTGGSGG